MANFKRRFGLNPDEHFHIPQDVYDFFSDIPGRGDAHEAGWQNALVKYQNEDPALAAEFALRVAGKMPEDWTKCIPRTEDQPTAPTATRKSAGIVTNNLAVNINSVLVGTADLTPSVNVAYKNKVDFQSVSTLYSAFCLRLTRDINVKLARTPNCLRPERKLQRSLYPLRYPRARHVLHLQRTFCIQ